MGLSRETLCRQGVQGPGVRSVCGSPGGWVPLASLSHSVLRQIRAEPRAWAGPPMMAVSKTEEAPSPRGGRPSRERPVVPRRGSPRT